MHNIFPDNYLYPVLVSQFMKGNVIYNLYSCMYYLCVCKYVYFGIPYGIVHGISSICILYINM